MKKVVEVVIEFAHWVLCAVAGLVAPGAGE
jgi:hypothetical protein